MFINEYGNRLFWSNGIDGALWHSYALSLLWKSNINPVQFPISEFRGNGNDYRELGLFKDWTEKWTTKPAFGVYRNFYKFLPETKIIYAETDLPIEILGAKAIITLKRIIVWVTNTLTKDYSALQMIISNLPYKNVSVDVHNNLLAESRIKMINFSENLPIIKVDIKRKSSFCFVIYETNIQ